MSVGIDKAIAPPAKTHLAIVKLTQLVCFGLVLCFAFEAEAREAREARCSTSDDGSYTCQFRATDRDGSFEISAPRKPTYMLNMDSPGVAFGFANFGSRNVSLPGRYIRSKTEPGCWINDTTKARICAR